MQSHDQYQSTTMETPAFLFMPQNHTRTIKWMTKVVSGNISSDSDQECQISAWELPVKTKLTRCLGLLEDSPQGSQNPVVAGSLKYCLSEKHQLKNCILTATSPSVDWLYHSQFAKKQTHQPSWVTLKQSYIGIGELGPLHIAKQLGEMLYSALCERERGSLWGSNVQVCRHYTMRFLRSIHLLME